MINFIKADLYRIRKMTSVKVCFALCCVSAIMMTLILYGMVDGSISAQVCTSASLLVDVMLVSLLGGVLTGGFISDDFESKNVHNEIACGKGRGMIVISKMLSFAVITLIITLPYLVVCVIGFASGKDFASLIGIPSAYFAVLSNNTGVAVSAGSVLKSILVCLLICYAYIGRLCICVPMAFKFRKPIPVIIVGFVTAFVFDLLLALVSKVDFLSGIVKLLPYYQTYEFKLEASAGTLLKGFLLVTVFIVLITLLTRHIFKKEEIK